MARSIHQRRAIQQLIIAKQMYGRREPQLRVGRARFPNIGPSEKRGAQMRWRLITKETKEIFATHSWGHFIFVTSLPRRNRFRSVLRNLLEVDLSRISRTIGHMTSRNGLEYCESADYVLLFARSTLTFSRCSVESMTPQSVRGPLDSSAGSSALMEPRLGTHPLYVWHWTSKY